MVRVSFVIGGTQKGGTTALESFLRQHPKICLPHSCKETHFFDTEENFTGHPEYERYHSFFRPEPHHQIIGEATPIYMYWNTAPYRIWRYNPHMKWILVLRNPVARAFSAWNMEVQRQAEKLSFREAVAQETVRRREALPNQHRVFSYLDRGYYAHQVRRLWDIFGEKNCLILLNEDLRDHHDETVHAVHDFLEIDKHPVPPPARVFEHPYEARLDFDLQAELIDRFYFDIRELEHLLGRDLSAWYAANKPLHSNESSRQNHRRPS